MDIFLPNHFKKLKTNLELQQSFDDLVRQRHKAVRSFIENNSERSIETKLIGSLQRQTRIHPRAGDIFDIDILVILGTFNFRDPSGTQPQQLHHQLSAVLQPSSRYSAMDLIQDDPTISFTYNDAKVKVELVPAYRDNIGWSIDNTKSYPLGRCYWIHKEGQWEIADYDHEADYVSQTNEALGGRLVPFIKVLKAIKRNILDVEGLSSVHLEILSTELLPEIIIRRNLEAKLINTPLLLLDFWTQVQQYISAPLNFTGSHFPDRHIKEPAKSFLLRNIPTLIGRITSLLNPQISERSRVAGWRELIGNVFPEDAI